MPGYWNPYNYNYFRRYYGRRRPHFHPHHMYWRFNRFRYPRHWGTWQGK